MEFGLIVDDSRPSHRVLVVRGELDVYTAPRLREKVLDLVNQGDRRVVVDLEGVEFLDSFGLGALVAGLKCLRSHNGDLSLVCTHPRTLKLFQISGLRQVFTIYDTADAAVSN